jgi:hypothetical protein
MQDFEKLGLFYLGRPYDLTARTANPGYVLYDSRDLVTHGVAVGMTGSGKTGLCLGLIEEAAIDGVPVIAIDPKGDLPNLLLTFPHLRPSDFRPWIDADEANRRSLSPDEYAAEQAAIWQRGLAEWQQDGARIQRLKDAAEFAVYTPGSATGLPLSILKSLAAPPAKVVDDPEAFGDAVATTVTSLLTLAGIEAEPVRSREHVLLSTIFATTWKAGGPLDLAGLIQQVQQPPTTRIGVLEVDAFYPPADRFELAMRLNQILAAPGFELWLAGEPLDVDRLLHTPEGRPRVSIISIAHLNDAERMSFVALLLNQIVGWMRGQSGTRSLRALVYMDEIYGFFPPVANPPAKAPLLTLLKQGRAFGLGVLLATQNPVDLDYKGLANCGTWFLGRMQTDRDRARVLDGLEGAATAAGFDRAAMERTLSGLSKRIFLLHSVHEPAPIVFETRWTLSYLRGPMTRDEIQSLMKSRHPGVSGVAAEPQSPKPSPKAAAMPVPAGASSSSRPVLPPGVPQFFLPIRRQGVPGATLRYDPMLFGSAAITYSDRKHRIEAARTVSALAPITSGAVPVDWDGAGAVETRAGDLERDSAGAAAFGALPAPATNPKSYEKWARDFARWVSQSQTLELARSSRLDLTSEPGEAEREFRIRLQERARELRDEATDKLRQKYAAKAASMAERIRKAELVVAREAEQASQQKVQTAVSFGATILGALFGRKAASSATLGRATTAARGVGRSMKDAQDVRRAQENLDAVRAQKAELEAALSAEIDAQAIHVDPAEPLERVTVRPNLRQVGVELVALVWVPSWTDGTASEPAWEG